jgi:hypothetical protein
MNLPTALLIALERIHPHMAREELLLLDANCLLPAPATATLTELRAALGDFERRRLVVSARTQAGHALWKITALGRAALAEIELGM